jgi:DNA-binding IclR family transcriptional regulator
VPPTGRPAERRLAAVERALRVLDAFMQVPGDVRNADLVRLTGINAATVSRTLSTLVDAGYVQFVAESGRYRLGTHLLELSNHVLAGLDLRGLARPHLIELGEATGETVTLSIPGERDAVTVDFVPSRASVASVARVGRPSVAHATATGKVALAFAPPAREASALERYTDRTIVDHAVLDAEVARVREQGWARAEGEREPDLNAIAAPVFGASGELAAVLGLQGPASRFDSAAQDAALPALRTHAAAISHSLGHS